MAGLPGVNITFGNGNIPVPVATTENVVGLVIGDAGTGLSIGTNYLFQSWAQAVASGADNNTPAGQFIEHFFRETAIGILHVRTADQAVGYEDLVAVELPILLQAAQNKISTAFVLFNPPSGYTATILDGMDSTVYDAMNAAQGVATDRLVTHYSAFTVYLQAYGIATPSALRDLKLGTQNRVGVIVADGYAVAGAIAGRIAISPVQRKISRVKDGALAVKESFILAVPTEDVDVLLLDELHDKHYTILRTIFEKTGYYVAQDWLASNDDYLQLTRRRSIDKAYRIALKTLTEELNDEVPITGAGEIVPTYVKWLQGKVVQAIATGMTAKGELSADPTDPKDQGVKFNIPTGQNIVTQNTLAATLSVRPFGYNAYINVDLGFTISTQ